MISNMPDNGLILAVDGPSGTGKSTTCRALAKQLDAKYIDTGAMYRVATLAVLRKGIDPADTQAVIAATADLPLTVSNDPDSTEVLLDGEDVSKEIREDEVTRNVSSVSAIPEVRTNLVNLQRKLASESHRAIVEGRDIGTVVFPQAEVKVFLTADPRERARRRVLQRLGDTQLDQTEIDALVEKTLADIERRDDLDSHRAVAPLRAADDAYHIDSSSQSIEAVCDKICALVKQVS